MSDTSKRGRSIVIRARRLHASKEWRAAQKRWAASGGAVDARAASIVMEYVLTDTQAWRYFKQLRGHLERYGMTRDEALARIAAMTRTDEAGADGSAADAAIERLAEVHGRAAVAAALNLDREEVKKRSSAARAARRGSGLKKDGPT